MRSNTPVLIACLLELIFSQCDTGDSGTQPITGQLVYNSNCKSYTLAPQYSAQTARNESWIRYIYIPSTRTLRVTHENAGFNCCPGKISTRVKVEGNTITLLEEEEEADCNCLCLFDLEVELYNMLPEVYLLKIEEPYIGDNEPLVNIIDLFNSPTGAFGLTRYYYPWGVE